MNNEHKNDTKTEDRREEYEKDGARNNQTS